LLVFSLFVVDGSLFSACSGVEDLLNKATAAQLATFHRKLGLVHEGDVDIKQQIADEIMYVVIVMRIHLVQVQFM
jgi:hypothetical protein